MKQTMTLDEFFAEIQKALEEPAEWEDLLQTLDGEELELAQAAAKFCDVADTQPQLDSFQSVYESPNAGWIVCAARVPLNAVAAYAAHINNAEDPEVAGVQTLQAAMITNNLLRMVRGAIGNVGEIRQK